MFRIVADSSCNVTDERYVSVPLTIGTDERQFRDDADFNINEMVEYLAGYSGRSGSACPGSEDWIRAFGDAQYVFCITMTSHLSGSYNSARLAAEEYESEHPGRRVYVVDSLSTGGEMELIADKISEFIAEGMDFDTICTEIEKYADSTKLIFCLKSLNNLVNNGRVSGTAAKISKFLNLRIIGRASTEGELQMHSKPRGDKNAVIGMLDFMKELGYCGGRVIIGHCLAEDMASALSSHIKQSFPYANVKINKCGALCSFYAEVGGLIIGFEN